MEDFSSSPPCLGDELSLNCVSSRPAEAEADAEAADADTVDVGGEVECGAEEALV